MLCSFLAGLLLATGTFAAGTAQFAGDTNENNHEIQVPGLSEFFNYANSFFGKYVREGRVDYPSIHADPTALHTLTKIIGNADLRDVDQDTKLAFYLDAYNILVIASVIDHFPLSSPLDVKGFFDTEKHLVAGEYLTLNDLENTKLRPDPRVHFSLVCAARGCPKIQANAFMPNSVQTQLDQRTKLALNDPDFIRIDQASKTAQISQIFDWYKDDFVKNAGSVRDFINAHRDNPIPADYSVSTYTYDWKLNTK